MASGLPPLGRQNPPGRSPAAEYASCRLVTTDAVCNLMQTARGPVRMLFFT